MSRRERWIRIHQKGGVGLTQERAGKVVRDGRQVELQSPQFRFRVDAAGGQKAVSWRNLLSGSEINLGKGTVAQGLEYLTDKGFEIGSHTYTHIHLNKVTTAEEIQRFSSITKCNT